MGKLFYIPTSLRIDILNNIKYLVRCPIIRLSCCRKWYPNSRHREAHRNLKFLPNRKKEEPTFRM